MSTTTAVTRRLLDAPATREPLPRPSLDDLLQAVTDSGLTGRGGAGFPTAIKVRSVAAAGRKPVVVGNGMEGEPLSHKDAVLLTRNPHLVLDGLEILGRAMHAKRAVLAVGPEIDPAPAQAAARGRKVEVVPLAGGFIAGQETALVNQLDGRPALPRDPFTRVTESGVAGRPTLVLNAETLAQVGLVARHGAAWFRSAGTADDPGTSLFTVTGSVARPGVVEAPRGTSLRHVLAASEPVRPTAVLVGGYHGAWVPTSSLDVPLTRMALAPWNAAVGAGVLHVLDDGTCPLRFAAEVVDYLSEESARQCGPCLNGLPHLAKNLHRLASGVRDPRLPVEIARMARQVTGRGACAHPDGSARFVASTLDIFRDHVAAHLEGWCPTRIRRAS
jgi:NADH:ubiquinone oxidoreductase subunit F (NADH-binding)